MSGEVGEQRASEAIDALERVRASFGRQGLMRLLGAEVVSAGRRLFVCKAEVATVENGEECTCATLLQTVSLSPVREQCTSVGEGA